MMKPLALLPLSLLLFSALLTGCPEDVTGEDAGVTDDPRFDGYGEPLEAPDDEWSYHEFPEAVCGNGEATGIGVLPSTTSTKVLVYLEGGGACWNAQTCGQGLADFVSTGVGEAELENFFAFSGTRSIFDRSDENNPFKDFSFVYVPYCTGDVHSGSRTDNTYNVSHKGFDNIGVYLDRVVPTLKDASEVVLSGSSAGGFGATYNYEQVREAFIDLPTHLLIDSAPPVTTNLYPIALYDIQAEAWNTNVSTPDYCIENDEDICPEVHTRFLRQLDVNADSRVALITSTGDSTLRQYFGLDTFPPRNITPEQYEAGIRELSDILEPYDNIKVFMHASTKHVYLRDEPFGDVSVNDTSLNDFVRGFLAGDENFTDVITP